MPVIGLPKILENNINTLLDTAKLSSWNVRGEDENMQISLRFSILKDTDKPIDTSNITYRRVPPCQSTRNRQRASQKLQQKYSNPQMDFPVDNLRDGDNNKQNQINDTEDLLTYCSVINISPLLVQDQVDGHSDIRDIDSQQN